MKLQLPPGAFRAYLFDCDGTIVDSMPLHYIAWKQALGEWNCPFDEELFYAWGGKPPVEIIADSERDARAQHAGRCRRRAQGESLLRAAATSSSRFPRCSSTSTRSMAASLSRSSPAARRESDRQSLTAVGLLDRFDILVGSEDYERSKPAPDAFLAGAARLGVRPERLPRL